jgi:hypothetical protein
MHQYEKALLAFADFSCIGAIQKQYVAVKASHDVVATMRDRQYGESVHTHPALTSRTNSSYLLVREHLHALVHCLQVAVDEFSGILSYYTTRRRI